MHALAARIHDGGSRVTPNGSKTAQLCTQQIGWVQPTLEASLTVLVHIGHRPVQLQLAALHAVVLDAAADLQ